MKTEKEQAPKQERASKSAPAQSRRRRVAQAVWLPIWVVISFAAASLLAYIVIKIGFDLGFIPYHALESSVFNTILAAAIYSVAAVVAIGLPAKLNKSRTSKEELGLQRLPSWEDILLAPASFVVYFILSGILVTLAIKLFPMFDVGEVQDVGFSQISRMYEYLLAFLTLVVIAPVAEEVLFRGYLYGKLRKAIPMVPAMLLTAALFAALHMQWNVAVDVFALSLVMTSLREVSGSIWAGILLHMLKNGVAFYVLFINPTFLTTIGM